MSNEKKNKKEPKKPDSGKDSQPNTFYAAKSKDGVKNFDRIKKTRKHK